MNRKEGVGNVNFLSGQPRKQKKKVSILGDSVSTFEGCNPQGYSVFYIGYYMESNELTHPDQTWWSRVVRWLDAEVLMNDAYSGSRASGGVFPSASCEERLCNLRVSDVTPDIIIVYIGFNDFGYGVPLRRKHRLQKPDLSNFEDAYAHLLHRLRELYPNAWLLCATLMLTRLRGEPEWKTPEQLEGDTLDAFNAVIRKHAQGERCVLADLAQTGMRYETLDGTHPTAEGHQTFADTWISCLMQQDFPRKMNLEDMRNRQKNQ